MKQQFDTGATNQATHDLIKLTNETQSLQDRLEGVYKHFMRPDIKKETLDAGMQWELINKVFYYASNLYLDLHPDNCDHIREMSLEAQEEYINHYSKGFETWKNKQP